MVPINSIRQDKQFLGCFTRPLAWPKQTVKHALEMAQKLSHQLRAAEDRTAVFYRPDLTWKITHLGFPKNYVVIGTKPKVSYMSGLHPVPQIGEHVRAHSTSVAVIKRLQAIINSVLQSYRSDAPYALLDFPNHSNVGDSAIWAGELAYLRRDWQRDPSYACELGNINWTELIRAVPSGPILLHGGGNFGDIWPAHHHFREEVLNRYPNRTVIQLPQSIQFNDPSSLRRTAQAIARHKSFVLLVRDQASYDLARDNFECVTRLCPDMAFCLGQLARPIRPTHSLVVLLRTDKEAAGTSDRTALKVPRDALIEDWIVSESADTYRRARIMSWLRALASLDPRQVSGPMARRVRYYDQLANLRICRGITLISRGRQLISDRLHAHIIGTLLDVPQVILDNNYGKLGRFIDTWKSDWTGVRRAADLSVALEAAAATHGNEGAMVAKSLTSARTSPTMNGSTPSAAR